MSEETTPLGAKVRELRKQNGWTQVQLGAKADLGDGGGVTVAKIELGRTRKPEEKTLRRLAEALGVDLSELNELAKQSSRPGALSGPRKAKENQALAKGLEEQMTEYEEKFEAQYRGLTEVKTSVAEQFIDPLLGVWQRITGLPLEAVVDLGSNALSGQRGFAAGEAPSGEEYFATMAATVAAGMFAGGAAGALAGATGAMATYTAVGIFGTASTGTAISALSGIAASNATLAAIGGGATAAGGGGIAVGTAVLAATVAVPALLLTAAGATVAGWKIADQQLDIRSQIEVAKEEFAIRKEFADSVFPLIDGVKMFLTFALLSAEKRLQELSDTRLAPSPAATEEIPWDSLSKKERDIFTKLVRLAVRTFGVLQLPVVPDFQPNDPELTAERRSELLTRTVEWHTSVLEEANAWFVG